MRLKGLKRLENLIASIHPKIEHINGPQRSLNTRTVQALPRSLALFSFCLYFFFAVCLFELFRISIECVFVLFTFIQFSLIRFQFAIEFQFFREIARELQH